MTPISETVWLVTGCSTGFGREIANCALQQGARVAVTARNSDAVADICERFPDRALALELDITSPKQREAALQNEIAAHPLVQAVLATFPGATIAAVREQFAAADPGEEPAESDIPAEDDGDEAMTGDPEG